jgi:hypothetical protein
LKYLKLDKVTKKIDGWHAEKCDKGDEPFERDDEFVEVDGSPTHFSSSDESIFED